jgi:hypothetical protein
MLRAKTVGKRYQVQLADSADLLAEQVPDASPASVRPVSGSPTALRNIVFTSSLAIIVCGYD